jgi:hypothetical protein
MLRPTRIVIILPLLAALTAGPVLAATVSGFVRSAASGEALPLACVAVKGTPRGAQSNEKGYYVVTGVGAGAFEVKVSCTGYAPETRLLTFGPDAEIGLNVELRPQAIQIEAVEVSADRKDDLGSEPTRMTLRTQQLNSVPAALEADLFRAVQALPGVSTLSDFSSGLFVRGGSADQNLILLDDVDVYNPSHLFGFFSTFNVDAVKTVDLQKSGYPARYGGRLSSLLDVHNRDGNRKEFQGTGRVGLLGASTTLEGPWQHGSWMLSGRRTYLQAIGKAAGIDLPYNFYDVHARGNYDLSEDDRAGVSYFRGRDRLDWGQKSMSVLLDWGNDTWSAQWTHLFNRRLFSHFVLGSSRFNSVGEVAFQDFKFKMKDEIRDIASKGNLSYTPSPNHLLDFGLETKALNFLFRREAGEQDRVQFKYDGIYAATYGQDRWQISPQWQIQPGLRLDYYSDGDRFRLGPRLSVQRQLNEMTALHATYGRYYQFLNLVSEEGASFADMWFPVDRTLKPGASDHYILGVDFGPYESFGLWVEGYYKRYDNLVEFSEEFGRQVIDNDARLSEAFNQGKGHAEGFDVYLRNHVGGCEGWIGYAYGVTKRKINGFNYGREYFPKYDRRHQITLMQSRPLGKGWTVSASFRYGTGQPTTLAAGRYTVRDVSGREYDEILPGDYNGKRLPDFHRLDLGLGYKKQFRGWTLEPSLEIVNVYNRKNVYLRNYNLEENPARFDDVNQLPLLPTITINATF